MQKPEQEPQLVMGYWTYLLLRVFIPKLRYLWKRYAKSAAYTLGAVFGMFMLVELVAASMWQYTISLQQRWDADVLQPCISERLSQTDSENLDAEDNDYPAQLPPQGDLTKAQNTMADLMVRASERVAQQHSLQQQGERHLAAYNDCLASSPPRPGHGAFASALEDFNDRIGSWF
jgi:hypothetical protein